MKFKRFIFFQQITYQIKILYFTEFLIYLFIAPVEISSIFLIIYVNILRVI
jgi:hypothetical protein